MNLAEFIKIKFNITTKNQKLYQQALTHRSYLNESKDKSILSYERLEFLGDSILSLIISKKIYHDYPNLPEGDLTNLRSVVVKTETLARITNKLGINVFLRLSKGEEEGGGKENNSILADTLEAIIAAIFLDQGIDKIETILTKLFSEEILKAYQQKTLKDYKSLLQEISQEKNSTSPIYTVIKEEGPDHKKTFTVNVSIAGKVYENGEGQSKQEAEQDAAHKTLEKWPK